MSNQQDILTGLGDEALEPAPAQQALTCVTCAAGITRDEEHTTR